MKFLSKSYIALILAIMYIPILVLMLFSFNSTRIGIYMIAKIRAM